MKKPDLKPCPFCGGKAISQYIPPHEHFLVNMPPYEGAGSVECLDCECAVVARTEEEAIEKWNSRIRQKWVSAKKPPNDDRYVLIYYETPDRRKCCIGCFYHDENQWYEDRKWFAQPLYGALLWTEMPQLPTENKEGATNA